jgi:hypothetical protein
MDTDHPLWPQYEARFNELAFLADDVTEISIPLDECEAFLCLYGENGLSPEEELALAQLLENCDITEEEDTYRLDATQLFKADGVALQFFRLG